MLSTFQLALWAFLPPLAVLAYYYRPLQVALSLPKLLLLFGLGNIAGLAALALEWGVESLAQQFLDWDEVTQPFRGVILRQFLEVAPIEEGAKFFAVLWAIGLFGRRTWIVPAQPSITFLAMIAVAMGFAAEENLVYLRSGTASIFARLIGTPIHAFFSAPWGYALGLPMYQAHGVFKRQWKVDLFKAWLNSVVCHALVNTLSNAWRYPPPDGWLSYGLFPFLLWLFWRMHQYWQRAQGRSRLPLISGLTRAERFWQRGLVLFALVLGGNAILGLFLLGNTLSGFSLNLILMEANSRFWRAVLSRLLLNLIPAVIAWGVYRYLYKLAYRRQYSRR